MTGHPRSRCADIDDAEAIHAAAGGALAIRCDVLEANEPLRAFYERQGYIKRGSSSHSGWQFTCYERLLGAVDRG